MAILRIHGKEFKHSAEAFDGPIHSDIEKLIKEHGYFIEESEVQAEEEAQFQIETYLKRIKNYILKNNDDIFAQIIVDNLPSNLKGLFNYSDYSPQKAGFKFEEDLASIFQSTLQYFAKEMGNDTTWQQEISKALSMDFVIGATGAAPKREFTFDQLKKFYPRLTENLDKAFKNKIIKKQTNGLYTLGLKMGKGDVSMPGGINHEIIANLNPEVVNFYKLLASKRLSLKNTNKVVHLGTTNWRRILISVFSQLEGYDNETLLSLYYRTRGRVNEKVGIHKSHIRFLYELTGTGLYYDGDELEHIDYIIINQNGGSDIRVYSTKLLLRDIYTGSATTRSRITINPGFIQEE